MLVFLPFIGKAYERPMTKSFPCSFQKCRMSREFCCLFTRFSLRIIHFRHLFMFGLPVWNFGCPRVNRRRLWLPGPYQAAALPAISSVIGKVQCLWLKQGKTVTPSRRCQAKRFLPFKWANSVISPSISIMSLWLCMCRIARELNFLSVMVLHKGVCSLFILLKLCLAVHVDTE